MSFDCSRFPFRPEHDFSGVVMQQGRVQLDSDWNEWLAEMSRRIQAGTLDTFGRAVVPSTTPNAFLVTLTSATSATIGPGRMYVDGLLVENHGLPAQRVQWDSALAEMSAAPAPQTPPLSPPNPAPAPMNFIQQPYYPGVTFPSGGPFLAYIDVWQRPVTYLQHPDLIEKAVGIDTTARLQTVWQVDLLDLSGMSNSASVTCATDIPAWDTLIQASGAQLTTGVSPVSTPGLCSLTTSTGYTGVENQLYRVEIHQPGGAPGAGSGPTTGMATFKWSRDNASVATAVTTITPGTSSVGAASLLSVESTGKDDVLCFLPGDWIEITDDYLELRGECGELHQIDANGVDPVGKTILLVDAVGSAIAGRAPPAPSNPPSNNPNYHTRICRWNQSGQVLQSNGTLWYDLGAKGSTGDIPMPPLGTPLILENGVTVTFGMNTSLSAKFKSCDFWAFAARASDGSVEHLANAPPMGVHHHYAKLGVLFSPTKAFDCRTPWPPSLGAATESCACTVCVDVADFNKNNAAIGSAIAKADAAGGGRVCLGPGVFVLGPTSLTLNSLNNPIILSGHGRATLLLFYGNGAAIDVQSCLAGLRIEDLGIVAIALNPPAAAGAAAATGTPVAIGIRLQNTAQTAVTRCGILALAASEFTAATAATTSTSSTPTSTPTPSAPASAAKPSTPPPSAPTSSAAKPSAATAKTVTSKTATAKAAAAKATITDKAAIAPRAVSEQEMVDVVREPVMVDINLISQVDSVATLLNSYTLSPGALAIALDSMAVEVQLRDNFLVADAGIGKTSLLATAAGGSSVAGLTVASDWLLASDVKITDNLLTCAMAGIAIIDLTGNSALTYFGEQTAITDNRIFDCAGTGILVAGIAYATTDAAIRIADNHVEVPGSGIVCATDMAVIEGNNVTQAMTTPPASGTAPPLGIMVAAAATAAPPLTGTRIIGNSLRFLNGPGVVVAGNVLVSSILDNSISGVTTAGINIVGNTSCLETIIRDNEIMVVSAPVPGTAAAASQASFLNSLTGSAAAVSAAPSTPQAFGIWASTVPLATIQNNTIGALGAAGTTTAATGIMLQGVLRAIISGNDISETGQSTQTMTGISAAIGANFVDLGISGNSIAQTTTTPATPPSFSGITITATSDAKTAATVSVDNNGVSATSASTLINIAVTAAPVHCILTGNRCTQSSLKTPAIVSVAGTTVIASNNRVISSNTDAEALVISNGTTTVPATNVTVLGNIVDGSLKLNGTALTATTATNVPWGPLNIFK
jgi:Family of unknown function (DUF6519)